jgi:hypothetical protein
MTYAATVTGVRNSLRTNKNNKTKNLLGLSPRANYTDQPPPLFGEVSANFLRIEDVVWSARRIYMAVFSVSWTV